MENSKRFDEICVYVCGAELGWGKSNEEEAEQSF